jgi:hypothetical protein
MTPAPASDHAAPPLGEVGRITDVFIDPKKAFADIAARPSWIVPVVLLIVIGLAFTYTYSTRIGWDRYVHQIVDNSAKVQNMEPAQREQAIELQRKIVPYTFWAGSVLGPPIMILIAAAVLLLMCKMAGMPLKFNQMFAIVSYAMLTGLVAGILMIVVMFLKNPDDFNLLNPLAFNLGAFLEPPPATGKFIYGLAKSFDLFTFWTIALEAVGISVAAPKISFSKALMLVLTPWLVWTLVSSGLAGLFS